MEAALRLRSKVGASMRCSIRFIDMALAILGGGHADMAHESTAQHVDIGEAALRRDLLGGAMAGFQQLACRCHPCRFDPVRRRETDLAAKDPGEMARAEACPFRETGQVMRQ